MKRLACPVVLFAVFGLLPSLAAGASWSPAGNMKGAGAFHTATLLPSGKVLVAGGVLPGAMAQTELYDPATGTWSATGPLNTARYYHTATLLPSGKVLVAGGHVSSSVVTTSAELYDPATGTWTPTGSMNGLRSGHTATLLPSGEVLVAGGLQNAGPIVRSAAAELYDPATGTWTPSGSMNAARWCHTATLLPNGKVLVASGDAASSSAELYDPATGTWTPTGSLSAARMEHVATLLPNGKVLVAGGGPNSGDVLAAELYDPGTGTWTATGSLSGGRRNPTLTLLPNGKVLIAGGYSSSVGPVSSAEIYDPASGTWSPTASLATARWRHTAVLLPTGRVLVAAGENYSGYPSNAELYDPAAGTWGPTGSLGIARYFHTATLLTSGKVLAAGGAGAGSSAELYDPAAGTWTSTGALNTARYSHTATLLPDAKVLVAGGAGAGSSAELYDPATETWTPSGALNAARYFHTATLLASGKVLVAGGVGAAVTTELYDPATGTWTATGSLGQARYSHTATLLGDGKVLVAGGTIGGANPLRSAELYDPTTETWSPTASLGFHRNSHTATLLPNGKVLVAGGESDPAGPLDTTNMEELYDPDAETWSMTGWPDFAPRTRHTATLLPAGNVLTAGGYTHPYAIATFSRAHLYEPATGTWSETGSLLARRQDHTATLLPSGKVLAAGGRVCSEWLNGSQNCGASASSAELYDWGEYPEARRPVITSLSESFTYGTPLTVTGTGFRGDSEASGGRHDDSSVKYPFVRVMSIHNERTSWLATEARVNFSDDPMTLTVSDLPPTVDPGWHQLTVVTAGVPSVSKFVLVTCGLVVTQQPVSQVVAIGSTATFQVATQGGRTLQWRKDGFDIPSATGPSYTTPPVTAADAGSIYTVVIRGACSSVTSNAAALTVVDSTPPAASVLSPRGGEYWRLSSGSPANTELVTWTMSDDVRICQVAVSLLYSNNGGYTYQSVPAAANFDPSNVGGGGAKVLGRGGACPYPGEGTTSLTYTVPSAPPSGVSGSLYKIELTVTDQVGLTTTVRSANPFYIVQAKTDSMRTLILSNTARMQARMGIAPAQAAALGDRLQELAASPRVLGLVVDLSMVTDLSDPTAGLYAVWDLDASNSDKANNVLFGCHGPDLSPPQPLPAGCALVKTGIHDKVRELLAIYTGVKYLVLVGDDRIVPMARLQDRTTLLLESSYAGSPDLTATGTTVGQALAANKYLSDDPLGVLDAVRSDELSGALYIPDLAVGRLVEWPEEITTAIATFISQDGVLDLSALDATTGHKVLVTGYDFLTDSAKHIRKRWKDALGVSTSDNSLEPVDGSLTSGNWGETSVDARKVALRTHLSGNGGTRYAIASLSGHATHYEEGVPGTDPFNIVGLGAEDIHGPDSCGTPSLGALNLAGGVVYAVGCHGGLPVSDPSSGPCATDADHSLDLPQTMLSRGVVAYVANTGYGWGLKHGIGYGERLVGLLTEEMTKGGTVVTGEAIRKAKQRYYLETPRYDVYDEKSLMQWTFFGLPMYAVKSGIASGSGFSAGGAPVESSFEAPAKKAESGVRVDEVRGVSVSREVMAGATALPDYLTQLTLHFDFTAFGVYSKRNSSGDDASVDASLLDPGCSDVNGCYYTLNGLVSGATDLPLQPYFLYDSRLSGTSQHGVLWKGGSYEEETGWVPVFGELQSNGGDGSNHGSAPKLIKVRPASQRLVPGLDPPSCRPSDLELNSTLVSAGEALKAQDADPTYQIERHYRQVDLEVFYFNNTATSGENCDRDGPVLGSGPYAGQYHQVLGGTMEWAVPATDASGVWRVLVVYTDNTVTLGQGTWTPLELTEDGGGVWRGSVVFAGTPRVTYVIQAVDNRGNVTWLNYVTAQAPASGVDLAVPMPVDALVLPVPALSIDDAVVMEGDSGTTNAVFTVSLSPVSAFGVTVSWTTANGTAAAGSDYVSASGTLSFPANTSSRTVSVSVMGDTLSEGDETFGVTLSAPTNATLSRSQGVGTILDDDALPALSVDDVTVVEGSSGTASAFFTVSLSAPSGQTVLVDYASSDGGGSAGSDYVAASGTLSFPAGTTVEYLPVRILGDTVLESTETFFVTLSNPSGATVVKARGEGWILDNSAGQRVQFGAGNYAASEVAAQAVIAVKRTGGSTGTVRVSYGTSDGTAVAGTNYRAVSGTLSFGPGVVTRTFAVPILNTTLHENSQTVLLRLSGPTGPAVLGQLATAVLTIGDNDPGGTLGFSLAKYSVKENLTTATILVKRTGGTASGVTVDYATSDGTAVAGTDYLATTGTLSFGPNVASRSFQVTILDPGVVKGDRTVNLALSDPTGGAGLGKQDKAVLAILSLDPVLQFSSGTYRVSEAGRQAVIVVRRSGPATGTLMVDYTTSDGTATAGEDYTATAGMLTFLPGVMTRTFAVPVTADAVVEGNETVDLTLSNPGGGAVLGLLSTAVLTITTGDSSLRFSLPGYSVTELAGKAVITVKRSAPLTQTVTVDYATSDGTATAGEDYTPTSDTLVFGPGVASRTFVVPILVDLDYVTGETVNLTLSNPTGGAILGTPSAAVLTIKDKNSAGTLQFGVSDVSVSETGPLATITVTRTGGTAGGVSVDYSTSDGTAIAGENYLAATGTLAFGDAEVEKSFTVQVLDDLVSNANRTVTLTLSNPTAGAVLGARDTARLWIVENR